MGANYICLGVECNSDQLANLSNQNTMESNGWVFDVSHSMNIRYRKACGGETWYGYSSAGAGSVKIDLAASGIANLNYGNCNTAGVVSVSLNDKLISSANANVNNKVISFRFSKGDILKLTEEGFAIIKLNAIEIKCPGKD